jgi:hypothetical protein
VNDQDAGQGSPQPTQEVTQAEPVDTGTEQAAAQPQGNETSPPNSDEKEQKRRDNGFQRRINEIVKDRENYKAMAERERQERLRIMDLLEKSRIEPHPQGRGPQSNPNQPPKVEQFERYEDFLEARSEWAAERKFQQLQEAQQRKSEESNHQRLIEDQQRQMMEQSKAVNTLIEKAEQKYPDFYEKVFDTSGNVPISTVVATAILESDVGADVAYYLGTHPEEAQRIAKLSPTSQLREFGKMEVSLAKQQSAAPPPIKPVDGRGANDGPPGPNADMKTWLKWRNKQLGR